jgi:hypothetical protein
MICTIWKKGIYKRNVHSALVIAGQSGKKYRVSVEPEVISRLLLLQYTMVRNPLSADRKVSAISSFPDAISGVSTARITKSPPMECGSLPASFL